LLNKRLTYFLYLQQRFRWWWKRWQEESSIVFGRTAGKEESRWGSSSKGLHLNTFCHD